MADDTSAGANIVTTPKGAAAIAFCFVLGACLPYIVDMLHENSLKSSGMLGSRTNRSLTQSPADPDGMRTSQNSSSQTLRHFRKLCQDTFDSQPEIPQWVENTILNENYTTRGEGVFCIQGRNLYHDSQELMWSLPRGGTPLHRLSDSLVDQAQHVEFRTTFAVITTTLLSMFHMLNDFVLPWPHILDTVITPLAKRATLTHDALTTIPWDYVLLNINGTLRGAGSDEIALMAMDTLVAHRDGRRLKALIYGNASDLDPTVHCYCRAILQPPAFVATYPPHAFIAEGDPVRRRWTLRYKQSINVRFGFLPYGTYPIPDSEYQPFGLWPNLTISSHVPRLLFLLRQKNRFIGQVDEIAAIAKFCGFNVQVFVPELASLEQQARAARYADVLVGIHGQALTWVSSMDGTRAANCRELIELQHYGRPFKRIHNVYELLAADSAVRYRRVPATSATFDPMFVPNPKTERRLLRKKSFPHELPGFHYQTANYSLDDIVNVFSRSWRRVSSCIPSQKEIKIRRQDAMRGEPVWKA